MLPVRALPCSGLGGFVLPGTVFPSRVFTHLCARVYTDRYIHMFDVCMGPVGESLLKKEHVHILLSMASPLGPLEVLGGPVVDR